MLVQEKVGTRTLRQAQGTENTETCEFLFHRASVVILNKTYLVLGKDGARPPDKSSFATLACLQ